MTDFEDVMTHYVIYEDPADAPGYFVVRVWHIGAGEPRPGRAWYADTLEQARESIPPGWFRLPRDPDDDPTIVEVWI